MTDQSYKRDEPISASFLIALTAVSLFYVLILILAVALALNYVSEALDSLFR